MTATAEKDKGILSGSLWKAILAFALPIAASNMLQQLFNTADVAIVGQFAGKEALAAVGSNGPIINLLLNLFIGISVGANVVIARYIGEGDENRVKRAAHTAVVVSLISGFVVMLFGLLLSRPMLELMNSPEDVIDLATVYLKIYFLGTPFIMLYNFSAAILRSRGDTKRPLISLFISGIINVILNFVFVVGFNMSVAGVAIATVISNVVSSLIMLCFLTHEKGALKIKFSELKVDKRILKEFIQIGVPAGFQSSLFSISNIFVQSSMNSLGSDYVAASSAASNFEFYIYHLMAGFSQATVTFTGQNYGAGNYKRCVSVTKWCLALGWIAGGLLITVLMMLRHQMVYIFTSDSVVAELAVVRMTYILPFILVNSTSDMLSGSMRGVGHSLSPALMSIAGICGVRLIWIYTVFVRFKTYDILMLIYPVSWIITLGAITVAYFLVRKKVLRSVN